ncbi:putative RNA-directed DNA polymerase [Lupinus albus]|uniref:Putative RNA-directed DNA polymerase n=1 Tax=Lupinus albus TaxID=3870 RepID=A0A6A4NXE8_LUPAL|nr:putative RNA-directed DNA polymerase [Lupinus albus]
MISLLEEWKFGFDGTIELQVDNKSAINLAKNPVAHGRIKHIERKYHFLRDQVGRGKINLKHCRTEIQVANVMTKPLKVERFRELMRLLNIVDCCL